MKSGRNTEAVLSRAAGATPARTNPRSWVEAFGVALLVASLSGCGEKSATAPAESSADAAATQTVSTAPSSPNPAAADSTSGRAGAVTDPNAGNPAQASAMILVARGTFLMGDKDEVDAPPHEVTVGAFLIDKNLVTQEQYQRAMGENPSRWKGDKNPVESVRWSDAVRFCNKRSEAEGLKPCYDLNSWSCDFAANGYRLPTEAEWEFACRAGSTTAYFFGDSPAKLGTYAWFDKNSGGRPRPVGQKQPNAWGLHDMCGNVWQWCNDFYKVDYYATAPKEDPRGPEAGDKKVVRGGAWRFGAETCRSGYRYNESPGYADVCFGYDIYGFRCVRKPGAAK